MVAAGRRCSVHACVSRELQIKALLLARFLRIGPGPDRVLSQSVPQSGPCSQNSVQL